MTETLAEKTCAPCRRGIPPITRDEAQRLQAQACVYRKPHLVMNSDLVGKIPCSRAKKSLFRGNNSLLR